MALKVFVSRDSEERPWAPDYAHEAEAAQEIVKKLWAVFHHLPALYTVIANLHQPNADMVIMTERGVGVVELKHYFGRIAIDAEGRWFAGGHPIRSGIYSDPHAQVQAYAKTVREKTLQLILPRSLRRRSSEWNSFKFQTTVCFTNPNAEIDNAKKQVMQARVVQRAPWESQFSVTIPEEIPNWAASLRFEVDMGKGRRFEPYRLAPNMIVRVATLRLGATEWTEILELMPTGEPFGFLVLLEDQRPLQTLGLHKDEMTIGRDPSRCDIAIPRHFSRVSRVHARITRRINSVLIEDQSTHGTFVNGKPTTGHHLLSHDQVITLGGVLPNEKVCQLRFLSRESAAIAPRSTEVTSGTD